MPPKIKLIGRRFGRLVIRTRVPHTKSGRVGYLCDCDCGTKNKYVQDSNLISGNIRSCGCLQREELVARGDKKKTRLNAIWRYYRRNAKVQGRVWKLPKRKFRELISLPCTYCGEVGSLNFGYTGLDRIDNQKGYKKENVQPCCKRCNQARNDMTVDEFLRWVARVYLHLKGV